MLPEPEGATPLGPEELAGLKPTWISNRQELNEAEQANILAGLAWTGRTRRADLLSEAFICALHRAMFADVWAWAGGFRRRETNIGVEPNTIRASVRELLDTARYWQDSSTFPPDEFAVRFHHRLVQIHPFPNGNGRHTRVMADLLIERSGGTPFTWGRDKLTADGPTRSAYIAALRQADALDIGPLLAFARS
jgi:Fic-DOC domain mobile mystery protein B